MNNWKCAITLVTCCCTILTIAPSASADFVGVTTIIKDDPDTEFLCTQGHGNYVPGPLTVCNVFAVFDDPADRLLAVETTDLQVYNGANPDVFFQHPASGNTDPTAPFCNQITDPPPFGFPDLICDSFITIGLKCGEIVPWDETNVRMDLDGFSSNGHVDAYWFNAEPPNGQGDAGTYPNLQVLILQSSVAQGLSLSGTIDFYWVNVAGDLIHEVGIDVECAGSCGSCPTDSDGDGDTDAMDLAVLLGSWGPVDAGQCLDNDSSGSIDAFDLAVLLGAWGPCL